MGTNFYLEPAPCPCPCAHCTGGERLHIGKSSAGWCFAVHIHPEQGIHVLADWEMRWNKPEAVIRDEYGTVLTPAEMLDRITNRAWRDDNRQAAGWFSENHAEPGPNGLARHRIDRYCVGHGNGPYDYLVGEFS